MSRFEENIAIGPFKSEDQMRRVCEKVGKVSLVSNYGVYTTRTCIYPYNGTYCNIEWFKKEGFKLISPEEFLGEEESMSAKVKKYNVGDLVNISNMLKPMLSGSHPEYSNGARFVALNARGAYWQKGQVVRLVNQDNSGNPYFDAGEGKASYCEYWENMSLIPEGGKTKAEKPTVTSTMTVYSDGVRVNEETVEFDGQSFTREKLKETVARYQEVLRRPIATVATSKVPAKKGKK